MRRREFIAVAGSAVVVPIRAQGQQPMRVARIGFLGTASALGWADKVEALRAGLRDLGHVEGKNIIIEFRWADGQYDRLPALAAELVALNVDIIVTQAVGVLSAQQATKTVPIVMAALGDAIAVGAVQSLARPGGNITGSTFFYPELASKRVELLKEAFPQIRRVAVVFKPAQSGAMLAVDAMRTTAISLGVEILEFPVRGPEEFASAFAEMPTRGIDAAAMIEDPILVGNSKAIVAAAANRALPAIGFLEFAEAGGLLAYGVSIVEMHRRAAVFVDKILKGAKPSDLPVERPTKFVLVVNLKTAKALGITVPPSLLARADEVIE